MILTLTHNGSEIEAGLPDNSTELEIFETLKTMTILTDPNNVLYNNQQSKEDYERELAERQQNHLSNISKSNNTNNWRPCMHDQCNRCHGTGVDFMGGSCIHMISCPCQKCSPTY